MRDEVETSRQSHIHRFYLVDLLGVRFTSEWQVVETVFSRMRTRFEGVFNRPALQILGLNLNVERHRLRLYVQVSARDILPVELGKLLGDTFAGIRKIVRSTKGMPRQFEVFTTVASRYGLGVRESNLLTRREAVCRRVVGSGICYHVFNRTQHGQRLFDTADERGKVESFLRQVGARFDCKVFGWCVMENHYHLLLETGISDTISRIMKWLDWRIALQYNKRHCLTGSLWQGRFGDSIVERVNQNLLKVLDYIHCNPVRAGLVSAPQDYAWSSCRYYLSGEKAAGLVVPDEFLRLASKKKKRIQIYLDRLRQTVQIKNRKIVVGKTRDKLPLSRIEYRCQLMKSCRENYFVTPSHQIIKKDHRKFCYGLREFIHALFASPANNPELMVPG